MDLDREVIRDIISEVSTPGGIGITMARSSVRSMLVRACAAACTTAWAGSKPAIDLAKTVVEEKVSIDRSSFSMFVAASHNGVFQSHLNCG
jgi:hypothetical protein